MPSTGAPQIKQNVTDVVFYCEGDLVSKRSRKIKKSGALYQQNQAKRLLEEILEEAKSQGENSSKKIKKYAQEGILSIEQVEKDLEKKEDTTAFNRYTPDDAEFTESLSSPGTNKDWKKIFNQGKAKGLFRSYTSSNNLK